MRAFWYRESGLLLVFLAAGAAAALASGSWRVWMLVSLSLLGFWHLLQLVRLCRWLSPGGGLDRGAAPPQSRGAWGWVFDALYRRQRQLQEDRRMLLDAADTVKDIASAMSDGVLLVDALGAIDWCNQVATRLLGVRLPADRGRFLIDVLREPEVVQYFQRENFTEPLKLRSERNPAIYLQIDVTVYGAGRRMLLARDVTDVFRLERMRVDFVANVSHELRTPLTVINGYLETLHGMEDEHVPLAMLNRALTQMQAQSMRMEALVNDLTVLSRLESRSDARDSGQLIDVARLVARLTDEVPLQAGEHKAISVEVSQQALLLGQEKEIHSAFGNLINNACKYTEADGHVFVEWRLEAGRAVFEVRDDGEGIEAEHLPRLTERFYRVDKSRSVSTGGTGLGLAIVKHALMRHQATLEIDSEPGVGSCFRCVFPLHRVQLR